MSENKDKKKKVKFKMIAALKSKGRPVKEGGTQEEKDAKNRRSKIFGISSLFGK